MCRELGRNTASVGENYGNHLPWICREEFRAGWVPFLKLSSTYIPPPLPRALPSSRPPAATACTWISSCCGGGQASLRLPRGHSYGLYGQRCPEYDHQRPAGWVQEGTDLALATSSTIFSPISTLVPKEKIPGPHNLKVWPKVTGKLGLEVWHPPWFFPSPHHQQCLQDNDHARKHYLDQDAQEIGPVEKRKREGNSGWHTRGW